MNQLMQISAFAIAAFIFQVFRAFCSAINKSIGFHRIPPACNLSRMKIELVDTQIAVCSGNVFKQLKDLASCSLRRKGSLLFPVEQIYRTDFT
jgi:hypothetical protein